jgi:predicted DNA-binding transcriptional regulator AlpA
MMKESPPTEDELLETGDVARVTLIPAGTLRFYRAMDVGPRCFKLGRRVVYRRSDVDAWVAEQEGGSTRGGGHIRDELTPKD